MSLFDLQLMLLHFFPIFENGGTFGSVTEFRFCSAILGC